MNIIFKPFNNLLIGLVVLNLFNNCVPETEPDPPVTQKGYRPVYASYEEIRTVQTLSPQALIHPGKIYVKGDFLFVNDVNQGIHIINNQNPVSPQPISFISIPGNVDIAVKDNILYADNATDLVALDISNPNDIKLVKRIMNTFPYPKFPPYTNVKFECVDPSKGIVVRWEEAELQDAKCFR
ncbi:hypothetical protein GXP67_10855 [Rhodocytophaga rosea]|uniref:LVIVD repeat-containing protein n=1 Tax=Rhodocytophaga rosea TaxID=2704465 RepID=A0A6C0GHB0_9BACT|nr:hypothetical protein [Rhodocytophaga rosea]QHT67113.1 hypothetical protein GXP67_10855 [Rhodocytophaga rosea]